ncbi:MAG TPA: FAD-linked oxidase C-terminal domain-containing protein, partial [Deinococcales bacterium]|nr:FAD-linked oxidase C-terminal domain-containing protein [Deinococcales bacterium]
QAVNDAVFPLVQKYGGSWSGEHGDGLIRSQENRELFGDTLYEAFRDVKRAFDPDWLMNPGKIVDAPPMTDNLRFGPGYPRDTLKTHFTFQEDGSLLGAAEACVGVGACRKVDVGYMCPSYMATRDEKHSTRGRANVLRMALNGRLPGGLASQEVYDALDLCLECKACKSECPSQVDMAKMKYEFLQHWNDEHGVSLETRALGNAATVAPLGQKLAPLANAVLPLKPVRWLMERTAGIDRRRVMPAYARQDFASWFRKNPPASTPEGTDRRVALFADTWTMYNDPEIGRAAVKVLRALDYEVELVPYGCCGRPKISRGLLREAKKQAEATVGRLHGYVEDGVPVVGLEPSCVTAVTDDYRDLVPGTETERVADSTFMFEQFLAKEWTAGRVQPKEVFAKTSEPLMLHTHCQQKSVLGSAGSRAVLEWAGEEVREVDAGCCGMAGSFGYTKHELSLEIGEGRLFPAVREHEGCTVSCGFSCRHQIKDGTGTEALHTAQVLASALKDS